MPATLPPPAGSGTTSVNKALALLGNFTADAPAMGLSELARRAGMPKSTVHRLLLPLVKAALVIRTGTSYAPGPRLIELAALTDPERGRLRDRALPFLLDLYEATHETVQLAVLHEHEVMCVDSIRGHHGVGATTRIGTRMPVATSALGKALLAFSGPETVAATLRRCAALAVPETALQALRRELPQIRGTEVAFDREATVRGVVCVAAPLVDWNGRTLGAIAVSGPARRLQTAAAATAVRRTAAALAKRPPLRPTA